MIARPSFLEYMRDGYNAVWNAIPSWTKITAVVAPIPTAIIYTMATSNYSWNQAQASHQAADANQTSYPHIETLVTFNRYIAGRNEHLGTNMMMTVGAEAAVMITGTFLTGVGLFGRYCAARCRARQNRPDNNPAGLDAALLPDVEAARPR